MIGLFEIFSSQLGLLKYRPGSLMDSISDLGRRFGLRPWSLAVVLQVSGWAVKCSLNILGKEDELSKGCLYEFADRPR